MDERDEILKRMTEIEEEQSYLDRMDDDWELLEQERDALLAKWDQQRSPSPSATTSQTQAKSRLARLRTRAEEIEAKIPELAGDEQREAVAEAALARHEADEIARALPFLGRPDEALARELAEAQVAREEARDRIAAFRAANSPARLARAEEEAQAVMQQAAELQRELRRRAELGSVLSFRSKQIDKQVAAALEAEDKDRLRLMFEAGHRSWEVERKREELLAARPQRAEAMRKQIEARMAAQDRANRKAYLATGRRFSAPPAIAG